MHAKWNIIKICCVLTSVLVGNLVVSGCVPKQLFRPILASKSTLTLNPTNTPTPTITLSPTPTWTLVPSSTPTITQTPFPTLFAGYRTNQLVAYKSFIGQSCYYDGDILVSLLDGTNVVNLTRDLSGNKILGSWSHNGDWVVFGRWDGDSLQTTGNPIETWIMRSDGSQKKLLPFKVDPNDILEINWSPDNKQILSNCQVDTSPYGMCLMNIEDFVVSKLTFSGTNPVFSPDGNYYAWLDFPKVYVLSQGSSTPLLLGDVADFYRGNIMWLPDNRHILIQAETPGDNKIYSIAVDGTDTLQLVLSVGSRGYVGDISPDGRYLQAWIYTKNVGLAISVVDLTNNKILPLALSANNTTLFWTPDNKLVAKQNNNYFDVDLDTGQPTKINNSDWLAIVLNAVGKNCSQIQP